MTVESWAVSSAADLVAWRVEDSAIKQNDRNEQIRF